VILLCGYLLLIVPFAEQMRNRPVAVKLGYLPEAEVLKLVAGEHRSLVAQYAVVKVLVYFGSLVGGFDRRAAQKPEYFNMFKTMQTAVKLDPYNMDAYYFTQAAFTWEIGRVMEVNDMLDYGMRYRTWDPQLPFFAGFNAAYFLKDYRAAADYMKKAAEISGDPLFTNLTARYFYEAGDSKLGILFLSAMEKGAKDRKIRKLYEVRKKALTAVQELTEAIRRFRETHGRAPAPLSELVASGVVSAIPDDPYGGKFYIDEKGLVRSTSKFAFGSDGK
jgi:hypothetical protein